MKKFISLLICLVLLTGIIITASATNVENITPSTNVFIPGVTGQDVPVQGPFPTRYDAGPNTFIVYGEALETWTYYNPITGNIIAQDSNTQKNTQETSTEDKSTTLPEDKDQSVEYQIDQEEVKQEIFELTNKARQENNLPALTYNKDIQDAADLRAKEISTKFSHTRPDGSSCHTVVEKFDYKVTGENLIMADNPISEPEILLDTWMNSEGHRANILLADYTSIAIGLYEKDDVTYAVQIFMG